MRGRRRSPFPLFGFCASLVVAERGFGRKGDRHRGRSQSPFLPDPLPNSSAPGKSTTTAQPPRYHPKSIPHPDETSESSGNDSTRTDQENGTSFDQYELNPRPMQASVRPFRGQIVVPLIERQSKLTNMIGSMRIESLRKRPQQHRQTQTPSRVRYPRQPFIVIAIHRHGY